jgi:hypothetical protein
VNTRKVVSIALFVICLLTLAASAFAQAKPVPVPPTPKPLKYTNLRGVQYCEVWLFVPQPDKDLFVYYYNTSDFNNQANKMDTCPASMWAKVNPEELKAKYQGVATVFKNGPRGWTMDWIDLPVGPEVTFDGLKTRWMGQGQMPPAMANIKPGEMAYKPIQSHRNSTMHFDKGKPVFIIDDPDGTPWVMQAWSAIVDPSLNYDALKDMGPKLQLPTGWKYRVATLDKDLNITTPGGFAWITQDNLQNTYDACKDNACNFKP